MPDVVLPCVLSLGVDGMPRSTSFDRVSRPRAMMACPARRRPIVSTSPKAVMSYQARRLSTVCASQRQDGMPRPTSFDRVCCPKAVMACHARCRSTLFAVHGLLWHAPPDVVRSCALSKEGDVMPRSTSFDRVCFPKAMLACHARRRLTVCAAQR